MFRTFVIISTTKSDSNLLNFVPVLNTLSVWLLQDSLVPFKTVSANDELFHINPLKWIGLNRFWFTIFRLLHVTKALWFNLINDQSFTTVFFRSVNPASGPKCLHLCRQKKTNALKPVDFRSKYENKHSLSRLLRLSCNFFQQQKKCWSNKSLNEMEAFHSVCSVWFHTSKDFIPHVNDYLSTCRKSGQFFAVSNSKCNKEHDKFPICSTSFIALNLNLCRTIQKSPEKIPPNSCDVQNSRNDRYCTTYHRTHRIQKQRFSKFQWNQRNNDDNRMNCEWFAL